TTVYTRLDLLVPQAGSISFHLFSYEYTKNTFYLEQSQKPFVGRSLWIFSQTAHRSCLISERSLQDRPKMAPLNTGESRTEDTVLNFFSSTLIPLPSQSTQKRLT